MDKYLQLLEEKRKNAMIDKHHWEIRKYIPSQFTDEEINEAINQLNYEIQAYTDCIELYKSMQSKSNGNNKEWKEILKQWFSGEAYKEICEIIDKANKYDELSRDIDKASQEARDETYNEMVEHLKKVLEENKRLKEWLEIEQKGNDNLKRELYIADCDYKALKEENELLKGGRRK